MVFCNYLHTDDIHQRNHSKLTQDILKQFGLIKKDRTEAKKGQVA